MGRAAIDLTQSEISAFERGTKLPSLLVILRFARKMNISVESLIDDELDLPDKLPHYIWFRFKLYEEWNRQERT